MENITGRNTEEIRQKTNCLVREKTKRRGEKSEIEQNEE
jgi:hypothetical protein